MFSPGGSGDGYGNSGGGQRRDDDEKEKEVDPDREERLRAEMAQLLASNSNWTRTLQGVGRTAVTAHSASQPSAPTGQRRNQEHPPPSRLDEQGNVETLKAWLRHYQVDEAGSEFVKVLHHCAVTYDNSEIAEAVAYIRQRYDRGYRPPQAAQPQQQQLDPPPEQQFVVAGVKVIVQSRAYRHIHPSLWSLFVAIISTGSFAQKVQDAQGGITGWYQVTSTSDEQFTFPSGDAGIRIVASWNNAQRALIVYHAHPNITNYGTYF